MVKLLGEVPAMPLLVSARPATVLVVEDDVPLQQILCQDIETLGCQVVTAADGQIGLEMARQGGIDTILTDINMPNMEGLEMLKTLRTAEIETPIIFLTGWSTRDKLARALMMGCFDFLQKPTDIDHLLKTVKMALVYGLLLRGLEAEVDEALSRLSLSSDDMVSVRSKQRRIGLARIQRLAYAQKRA